MPAPRTERLLVDWSRGRPGPDAHAELLRLRLDEQGRQELARVLADLLDEVTQIEAESAHRLASAPRGRVYEAGFSIVPFWRMPPA